jgi:hypothetical protein
MAWDELHQPDGMVRLDESTLVERDVLNVVQQIMEYDQNLKVQYLEKAAKTGDAPWRIIERCKDGEWRVIFYTWQMDQRVIDRLRMADCHAVDILSTVDSHNASLRQREGRRFQERLGEAHDLTVHILKSPKGRYTFKDEHSNKLVTVDDDPKPSWKAEECS